jgi:hypothetical protein
MAANDAMGQTCVFLINVNLYFKIFSPPSSYFYVSSSVTSTFILLTLMVVGQALMPATYFTQADKERLLKVFAAAFGDDVEMMHYSILGYQLLGQPLPDAKVLKPSLLLFQEIIWQLTLLLLSFFFCRKHVSP